MRRREPDQAAAELFEQAVALWHEYPRPLLPYDGLATDEAAWSARYESFCERNGVDRGAATNAASARGWCDVPYSAEWV